MAFFADMRLFAIVAANALFPRTQTGGAPGWNAARQHAPGPQGFSPVEPGDIPGILADPSRAVNDDGVLALFFSGCPAAAAPFLLFRLKRMGYSRCCVQVVPGGLTLAARR
ncbi:hypothetical protein [Geobacter benzoatilyticus]|jgi:hypothetical protein|uniref:Uncharacterized protein n=1 Tax=Geobacter benzoatilyticus TaxID=2815309 RepID=A0ABX7Q6I6_9BACT|nr:hypothetical protein [Geobacter benzoatilyticus]QSV46518.1 hypothetical protein JZM60_04365 [Geobacter benzoatilyticus]